MNSLTTDEVVIDSNIFQHLISHDARFNPDGHIAVLLGRLWEDRILLCVDEDGRIEGEYELIIQPMLRNQSDASEEIGLLRYWMLEEIRVCQPADHAGPLMNAIEQIIIEKKEKVDRTFVAVAFSRGKVLVTNDVEHILDGPDREKKLGPRRSRLIKQTKKHRPAGAEILTSREAHDRT